MPKKINLFVNYWNPIHKQRREEIRKAVIDNCNSGLFENVFLIHDKACLKDIEHDKITWLFLEWRPSFRDIFAHINFYGRNADANICANTDITYDESIFRIFELEHENICLELSRYEPNGKIENCGEDAWIFFNSVKPHLWAELPLGELGCDYRITHELRKAGYHVFNPSLDVKSYHVHQSNIRYYSGHKNDWYKGDNWTNPCFIKDLK